MGSTICYAIICSIVLIMASSLAIAYPCERLGLLSECQLIDNSELSNAEKTSLIAGLITDVVSWNSNFAVSVPPENTRTTSNTVVSSAWVRITSITPHVLHNSRILSSGDGTLTVKSHYTPIRSSSGREGNDCRTEYDYDSRHELSNYLNGKLIGSGEVIRFSTNETTLHFESVLAIITNVDVEHYRWHEYEESRRCEHSYREHREERTVMSDSLTAYRNAQSFNASLIVEDEYFGLTQLSVNFTDVVKVRLLFGNGAFYEEQFYEIEPFFWLETYDILAFRSVPKKNVRFEGLRFVDNNLQVSNLNGCELLVSDFFNTYTYPCIFEYQDFGLTIQTDKEVYADGENISVTIRPLIPVLLEYAGENLTLNGSAIIFADSSSQLITARASGKIATKIIHVVRPRLWQTALGVLVFVAVLFFFTKLVFKRLEVFYEL